jgi:hypothetical protein
MFRWCNLCYQSCIRTATRCCCWVKPKSSNARDLPLESALLPNLYQPVTYPWLSCNIELTHVSVTCSRLSTSSTPCFCLLPPKPFYSSSATIGGILRCQLALELQLWCTETLDQVMFGTEVRVAQWSGVLHNTKWPYIFRSIEVRLSLGEFDRNWSHSACESCIMSPHSYSCKGLEVWRNWTFWHLAQPI